MVGFCIVFWLWPLQCVLFSMFHSEAPCLEKMCSHGANQSGLFGALVWVHNGPFDSKSYPLSPRLLVPGLSYFKATFFLGTGNLVQNAGWAWGLAWIIQVGWFQARRKVICKQSDSLALLSLLAVSYHSLLSHSFAAALYIGPSSLSLSLASSLSVNVCVPQALKQLGSLSCACSSEFWCLAMATPLPSLTVVSVLASHSHGCPIGPNCRAFLLLTTSVVVSMFCKLALDRSEPHVCLWVPLPIAMETPLSGLSSISKATSCSHCCLYG